MPLQAFGGRKHFNIFLFMEEIENKVEYYLT